MTDVLRIEQDPLVNIGAIDVSEEDVQQEPTIRRATPEFAYEVGGPILRRFLEIATELGHVHDNSLVMSQPSDFKAGALSTPQYWHFDFTPGLAPETDEEFKEAIYGNTGLITCAFSAEEHPRDEGTLFLQGGEVAIDLADRDRSREYVPRQNLNPDINSGGVYWWDPIVRRQIETNNDLVVVPLTPNAVYEFGSHHIHRVPLMQSDHGQRVLMRINTPTDPNIKPKAENTHIDQSDPNYPRYVFYETSPDAWVRHRY
jgi:hypothetical protein